MPAMSAYEDVELFRTVEGWRLVASVGKDAVHIELYDPPEVLWRTASMVVLLGFPWAFLERFIAWPPGFSLERRVAKAAEELVNSHRRGGGGPNSRIVTKLRQMVEGR